LNPLVRKMRLSTYIVSHVTQAAQEKHLSASKRDYSGTRGGTSTHPTHQLNHIPL
jgi:hypothetical protein